MAMEAVELAGLDAGAHEPQRIRVVLAQIPPVRVKIGVFEGREVFPIFFYYMISPSHNISQKIRQGKIVIVEVIFLGKGSLETMKLFRHLCSS